MGQRLNDPPDRTSPTVGRTGTLVLSRGSRRMESWSRKTSWTLGGAEQEA